MQLHAMDLQTHMSSHMKQVLAHWNCLDPGVSFGNLKQHSGTSK